VALHRRATAEGVGTLLLVLVASAGGIAAQKSYGVEPGLVRLTLALVLAGALVSLIVAFGHVSGGHFNPLITALQWLAHERSGSCALAYVLAQLGGGLAGGAIGAWLWHATAKPVAGLRWEGFASETVASAGLMLVVFGCMRGSRTETGPFAVGAWLLAAILATPTTSYANPAVVLGALVSAGPVSLGLSSALPFILAQMLGALGAFALVAVIFPKAPRRT